MWESLAKCPGWARLLEELEARRKLLKEEILYKLPVNEEDRAMQAVTRGRLIELEYLMQVPELFKADAQESLERHNSVEEIEEEDSDGR